MACKTGHIRDVNPRTGNLFTQCPECRLASSRKPKLYPINYDTSFPIYPDGKPSTIGTWCTDEYLEQLESELP